MCVVSASDCFGFYLLGIFFGFGWTGWVPTTNGITRGGPLYDFTEEGISMPQLISIYFLCFSFSSQVGSMTIHKTLI